MNLKILNTRPIKPTGYILIKQTLCIVFLLIFLTDSNFLAGAAGLIQVKHETLKCDNIIYKNNMHLLMLRENLMEPSNSTASRQLPSFYSVLTTHSVCISRY